MNSIVLDKPLHAQPAMATAHPLRKSLASISALRCIAAFFIVHYHASHKQFETGFLLAFVALTAALVSVPMDWKQFSISKAKRLLVPWLFWCGIYAAVNACIALRVGKPLQAVFDPLMPLYGTAPHLWYLPFAFAAALAAAAALKCTRNTLIWVAATIASIITAKLLARHIAIAPFSYWTLAFPAVFLGITLAAIRTTSNRAYLTTISCAAIGIASIALYLVSPERISLAMLIATALLGTTWLIRSESNPFLEYLAGLTFGIYLIHPLFLKLIWSLDLHLNSVVVALASTMGSAAVTAMLQRTELRKFV